VKATGTGDRRCGFDPVAVRQWENTPLWKGVGHAQIARFCNGDCIVSNNALYNPNASQQGAWQQLQEAKQ
jgi:hypothetical protein